MESWILRVSFKVSEALFLSKLVKPEEGFTNFERDPKYSWFHEPLKIELIAYIYISL